MVSGVPGEIYGYEMAHQIGGRLPWKELFQPTIDLCLNGYRVSRALGTTMRTCEEPIRNHKALAGMFINPATNHVYKEGDFLKRPALGRTLQLISEGSSRTFYDSDLTQTIVDEINSNGNCVFESTDPVSYYIFVFN